MIFFGPPGRQVGDGRRAPIKSRATQAAERLSFEGATVTKITYSGFYSTLDFGRNAELRISSICYSNPGLEPIRIGLRYSLLSVSGLGATYPPVLCGNFASVPSRK